MPKFYEFKASAAVGELDLYIYSDIGDYGGDEDTTAEHFRQKIEDAKSRGVRKINVRINSCGGSVFEALAIYSQLKRSGCRVAVTVDGFACSAASLIAMAGDDVQISRGGLMLIHNAWCVVGGNAAALRAAADDLEKVDSGMREIYLERAAGKIDEATLAELMAGETYLTAAECIRYGFADGIIGEPQEPEETPEEAPEEAPAEDPAEPPEEESATASAKAATAAMRAAAESAEDFSRLAEVVLRKIFKV